MEAREWAVKKKYLLQLLGQEVLEKFLGEEEYECVKRFEDGKTSRKKVDEWVKGFLGTLTPSEEKHPRKVLDVKELPKKQSLSFANLIVQRAFEVSFTATCKTRDMKSSSYDKMVLNMEKWCRLVEEHGSRLFEEEPDE